MLKITVHLDATNVVFQLEGKLAGAWVMELEQQWRETTSKAACKTVQFDLDNVQHVDNAGKYLLALLRYQRVQLTGRGLEIGELLQSICAEWPVNGRKCEPNP